MNNITESNMLDNLNISELSSTFLLGLSVGYFIKKGFKITLFIFGLLTIILFWIKSQQIIEINNSTILNIFDIISEVLKSSYNFVYTHIKSLEPLGGASVIVGFLTGLKIG